MDVVDGAADETVIEMERLTEETGGVDVAKLGAIDVCALDDTVGATLLLDVVVDAVALLSEGGGEATMLLLESIMLELAEFEDDEDDEGAIEEDGLELGREDVVLLEEGPRLLEGATILELDKLDDDAPMLDDGMLLERVVLLEETPALVL